MNSLIVALSCILLIGVYITAALTESVMISELANAAAIIVLLNFIRTIGAIAVENNDDLYKNN